VPSNYVTLFDYSKGNPNGDIGTVDLVGAMMTGLTSGTDDRRTGRYEVVMEMRSATEGVMDSKNYVFTIDRFGMVEGLPGGGGGTGNDGVGANSPTEEGQSGFWATLFQSLFVPNDTAVNGFLEAAKQYREWGPFGIAAELGEEVQSNENSAAGQFNPNDCAYCINFGNLPVFNTPFLIDLTDYQQYVRTARTVILMVLIWSFGWSIWRFATKSRETA
jgi:hypothetical protein